MTDEPFPQASHNAPPLITIMSRVGTARAMRGPLGLQVHADLLGLACEEADRDDLFPSMQSKLAPVVHTLLTLARILLP